MKDQPNGPRPASLFGIFITIFLLVFMVIAMAATLLTFILPESYASECRLKLSPVASSPESKAAASPYDPALAATEAETILSEIVLGRVVEQLDLNTQWGRKYANGEKLKTSESLAILKARLDVRPIPHTTLLRIRAFSEDREEAASLANAVAQAYLEASRTLSPFITAQLVDRATPGLRPIRPNKPLNITLGIMIGVVLGAGCATLVTVLIVSYRAKRTRLGILPDGGLKPIH